jgi:hypothetical protein
MMVELQGGVELPVKPENQTCFFLYWHDSTTPVCLIGHQMIRGKIEKLEKPFLVIDTREGTKQQDPDTKEWIGECKVVMIIRRRLLFKDRPKPVLF